MQSPSPGGGTDGTACVTLSSLTSGQSRNSRVEPGQMESLAHSWDCSSRPSWNGASSFPHEEAPALWALGGLMVLSTPRFRVPCCIQRQVTLTQLVATAPPPPTSAAAAKEGFGSQGHLLLQPQHRALSEVQGCHRYFALSSLSGGWAPPCPKSDVWESREQSYRHLQWK